MLWALTVAGKKTKSLFKSASRGRCNPPPLDQDIGQRRRGFLRPSGAGFDKLLFR